MMAHTPGEWKVRRKLGTGLYGITYPLDYGDIQTATVWLIKPSLVQDDALVMAASKNSLAALEAVEWVSPPWPAVEHEPFCPWCGNYKSADHRDDCSRQAAIAKARGGE